MPTAPIPDEFVVADLANMILAGEFIIGGSTITPDIAEAHGIPAGPALSFTALTGVFRGRPIKHPSTILVLLAGDTRDDAEAFVDGIRQAIETAYDPPESAIAGQAKVRAMNVAAGNVEPVVGEELPRCLFCRVRLFGELAARGACLACSPADSAELDAAAPTLEARP